MSLGHVKS